MNICLLVLSYVYINNHVCISLCLVIDGEISADFISLFVYIKIYLNISMFVGIFYLLVYQGSTQEDNWKDLDHVTESCPGEG